MRRKAIQKPLFPLIGTIILAFIVYAIFSVFQQRLGQQAFIEIPTTKIPVTSTEISPRDRIARQYSISPEPCPAGQSFTVVLICFSRPAGFELRDLIRKTWGQLMDPVCGLRLLFIVGKIADETYQTAVEREALRHGDIIQSNQFVDDYRSASIKALHLLQWGAAFCPEAVYIAKIDDDNWLNVPRYVKFLQDNQDTDHVFGSIFIADTLVRRYPNYFNLTEKYYVPREEYALDVYPEYLSGILYSVPTRFVHRLLAASKTVPRTFNDDVYVCGMLVDAANLTRRHVPYYGWNHQINDSNCPKCDKMCIHYTNVQDFHRMWSDPCCQYDHMC